MTKQDNLNKLCALNSVADRLPEDVDVIDDSIYGNNLGIHLSCPDEKKLTEAFGLEIKEVPYGKGSMKRYINICGVEVFWLAERTCR